MVEPVKRQYDSSKRQEQARVTRARIRDAAKDLFIADGYAATTISAIAEAAEVSAPTVYAAFGSKAAILSETIDVALAGDDEAVAIADRPEAAATASARTAGEAAALFARFATQILDRAGLLLRAADAAAQQDSGLYPLWLAGHRGRLADMKGAALGFATAGFLRDDITVDQAAELLWVHTDPSTYSSLRLILGWTSAQYEEWLRRTIETTLLRGQSPGDRRRKRVKGG